MLLDELIDLTAGVCPVPAKEIAPTMSLHVDLGMSSLEIALFVLSLEKQYSVLLRDKGITAKTTVADLAQMIDADRASSAG